MSTNDDRERLAAGTAPGPVPRLPVRASIYIDVDGTVHFGALFEGLVPVADALRGPASARGEPTGEGARREDLGRARDNGADSSGRGSGP